MIHGLVALTKQQFFDRGKQRAADALVFEQLSAVHVLFRGVCDLRNGLLRPVLGCVPVGCAQEHHGFRAFALLPFQLRVDAAGHLLELFLVDARQQNAELVAAQPRDDSLWAALLEQIRRLNDQPIPRAVAEQVVRQLERVDVHHDHGIR
ncbi:hypothetical protein SDC9_194321 [bioreactor metagenome]|uniref:Uncharacterized protein n=1 Tax=bioreactor metagenome TaxID=1076179 RepID=A0A645IH95_9ZZZZ